METPRRFHYFTLAFVILIYVTKIYAKTDSLVYDLNEDNWADMLKGEWMVEFYAPWCPACSSLQPAWRELANLAAGAGFKAGAVDVTQAPGLSGRFLVTALPTIFHVTGGEFRQYKGSRDAASMATWVRERRWRSLEPLPRWKSPDSLHMGAVSYFFKLSQHLRGVHNMLMETYGLPTWGSYLIFAVATIFIGALLGLILVCVIDLLYPPKRPQHKVLVPAGSVSADKAREADIAKAESDDVAELIQDDIVDDEEEERADDSDAEKNSQSDTSSDNENTASQPTTSEDTIVKAEGSGDIPTAPNPAAPGSPKRSPEVRKRRPRKAD